MNSEEQVPSDAPTMPGPDQTSEPGNEGRSSGEQLVDELGRLSRKFVELLETAWNSDQRRQIEKDLRAGLNSVAESLEEGLKEVSQKEETKEIIGKAENVADNVAERVRSSDLANELARGLANGLHTLADELDKLAREMRASRAPGAKDPEASAGGPVQSQDIPISSEEPGNENQA